jgi:hypothetical protein
MVKEEKSERFAVRLAPTELAMLRELAESDGESESVALRRAIRQAYAARFGDKKQPRKR